VHPLWSSASPSSGHIPSGFLPDTGEFAAPDNREGIKSVTFSDGEITLIELVNGHLMSRATPEPFYNYFLESTFPVIGFVVPWSLLKLLVWIVSGFSTKS
jgi:hypothetical protein